MFSELKKYTYLNEINKIYKYREYFHPDFYMSKYYNYKTIFIFNIYKNINIHYIYKYDKMIPYSIKKNNIEYISYKNHNYKIINENIIIQLNKGLIIEIFYNLLSQLKKRKKIINKNEYSILYINKRYYYYNYNKLYLIWNDLFRQTNITKINYICNKICFFKTTKSKFFYIYKKFINIYKLLF